MKKNSEYKFSSKANIINNDDEYLIELDDEIFYINEIVVDILNFCKKEYKTIDDIVKKIRDNYTIDPSVDLNKDIRDTMTELVEKNIVEERR